MALAKKKTTARKKPTTVRKKIVKKPVARTAKKRPVARTVTKRPVAKRKIVKKRVTKRPMRKTTRQTKEDVLVLQSLAVGLAKTSLALSTALFNTVHVGQEILTTAQLKKLQELGLAACTMNLQVFSGKIRLEEGLADLNNILSKAVTTANSIKKSKKAKLKCWTKLKSGFTAIKTYMPTAAKIVNRNFEGPVQRYFAKTCDSMTKKATQMVK